MVLAYFASCKRPFISFPRGVVERGMGPRNQDGSQEDKSHDLTSNSSEIAELISCHLSLGMVGPIPSIIASGYCGKVSGETIALLELCLYQ